jgi:serine/threonine-protein kinase
VLPFTGLSVPVGVAVDAAGDLYVTDAGNNRVLELAAGSATQALPPFTGLNDPTGVAVDSTGNVYVTDKTNNRVVKLPGRVMRRRAGARCCRASPTEAT